MTTKTATTQAELDAAMAESREHPNDFYDIRIESPRGVWIVLGGSPEQLPSGSATVEAFDSATVEASGSATVRAFDSATVEASGSATVEAFGSATVRAFDSATVRAFDSATVEASDSATVEASDSATVRAFDSATVRAFDSATVEAFGSATVRAFGSATVRAFGSATVRAFGSATVRASDSATVEAFGSATVRAFDSATVEASGSATVEASDSATVEAGSHTAVHLHSGRCSVTGGVLIDHTAIDEADVAVWASYHGAQVDGEQLVVYKAVRDDYRSARGTEYRPGTTASCDDFTDVDECGGGLHFSPSPAQAHDYDRDATRYVELRVPAASVRTITGGGTAKAKAASVECVREVDIHGRPIGGEVR